MLPMYLRVWGHPLGSSTRDSFLKKTDSFSKQPSRANSSSAGGGVSIAVRTGKLAARSWSDLFTGGHGCCGFMSAEVMIRRVKSSQMSGSYNHSTSSTSVLPEPRAGGGDLIELSRLWLSTLTSCDSIYNLLCMAKRSFSEEGRELH